jgi:hypothetical protein
MPRTLTPEQIISLFIGEKVSIYYEMTEGYGFTFTGETGQGTWEHLRDAWKSHKAEARYPTEIHLITAFVEWYRKIYKPPAWSPSLSIEG